MATKTIKRSTPIAGVSSEQRDAWLEQRRHGVTATQAAKAISGRESDLRAIVVEKITGDFPDLSGNKYIDWGNAREPVIAEWVQTKFDIAPNLICYAHSEEPRHLATPDGFTYDEFIGAGYISEIKTSKHDLNPFTDLPESGISTLRPEIAHQMLDAFDRNRGVPYFWRSGYFDQMQWQMHVMGTDRCLFVWEQHDDNWPEPQPSVPRAVWVDRDEARIVELVRAAESLLKRIESTKASDLAPSGEMQPEIADHVHEYLKGLADEKIGAAYKTKHSNALKTLLEDVDDYQSDNDEAKVTWARPLTIESHVDAALLAKATTAQQTKIEKADDAVQSAQQRQERAAAAKTKTDDAHAKAVERLRVARSRFTVTTEMKQSPRLTITAKKTK